MKNIVLNNGVEMPIIGYGSYLVNKEEECVSSILEALKCGYRHIDTAQAYHNEEFIGDAIKKSGVNRNEIFLTTKVWFDKYEEADAIASLEASLKKLKTDYLDLVLLHWPYGNYYAGYRALEKLYKKGVCRAIGVSNFNPDRFIDLIKFNEITPAVNQIETNLYCQRPVEREYMDKYGIAHESYAPLGQGKQAEFFSEPIVVELSKKYNKTPAQILLRHLIEKDIIIIPKSSNKTRIKENIDIFDFSLTANEISALNSLNKNAPKGGKPETPERTEQAMTWVGNR